MPETCPPEQSHELSITSIQTDTTGKEAVQFTSSTFFIYLPTPVSFVFVSFLQKVRQNNVSYADVGSSSTLTQVPFLCCSIGVFTAAFDCQIEWLIVKGIADYADGSQLRSESWSSCASVMAASLVAHILSEPCVFHSWPHYQGKYFS